MNQKNITVGVVLLAIIVMGYFLMPSILGNNKIKEAQNLDPTPQKATISGTYVCLPHLDTSGPQTMECAFGIKTDQGEYYAVNFGQSGEAMSQFQSGAHVTLEGFIVIKEALSSNEWQKYNMKGIFTVTKIINSNTGTSTTGTNGGSAKININVVCEGAIAYMTFTSGAEADKFVNDCKAGKHPEVIEDYKVRMGLGSGAAI